MTPTQLELSFDVRPHPDLEGAPPIGATLKIVGELRVRHDLHRGDELTVNVADADGTVISTGLVEVGIPTFKELTDKGAPIGTIRAHKATVTE